MKYHFVGIGGIGMSALARLAISQGAVVSGSDKADSPMLDSLRRLGATVWAGHAAEHVPADAVVIITDAIKSANEEVDAARASGQEVIRRSQLLGRLMNRHDGIAIAGTHGKTSTTAMVARVLLGAGLDPTVVVGGEAFGPEQNAHAGTGTVFVAEACEAYGAFEDLSPRIAVVTNIEPDHLDYHGTFEGLCAAFRRFASRIDPGGTLIVNADDAESAALPKAFSGRSVTYGLESGEWRAVDIALEGLSARYGVKHCGARVAEVLLPVPGRHNVSNSLAAFIVGIEVGLEPAIIAGALATYPGVRRRFERLGETDGILVYDDYAHHPTEVAAALAAARRAVATQVIAVFQPHLYSRTRDLMQQFIASFDDADAVVISGIYKSREEPIPGISGEAIAEGIRRRSPGKRVKYVEDKAAVPAAVRAVAAPGDLVLVMGAGDIREAGEALMAGAGQ